MSRKFIAETLAVSTLLTGGAADIGAAYLAVEPVPTEVDHNFDHSPKPIEAPTPAVPVVDLGSAALRRAVAVEPPPVRHEVAGVMQTQGALFHRYKQSNGKVSEFLADTIYASAFDITVKGVHYAVTAGHVTTPAPGNPVPVLCQSQTLYNKAPGAAGIHTITGRAGTYSGDADNVYYGGGMPDMGIFRLHRGNYAGRLVALPVRKTDELIDPGTILDNTNWQPRVSGDYSADRDPLSTDPRLATPDQMAGVVIGEYVQSAETDGNVVYGVVGVKAYAGTDEVIPGASGSPWETSQGTVVGLTSAVIAKETLADIRSDFDVVLRGWHGGKYIPVALIQSVNQANVGNLVSEIHKNRGCRLPGPKPSHPDSSTW